MIPGGWGKGSVNRLYLPLGPVRSGIRYKRDANCRTAAKIKNKSNKTIISIRSSPFIKGACTNRICSSTKRVWTCLDKEKAIEILNSSGFFLLKTLIMLNENVYNLHHKTEETTLG